MSTRKEPLVVNFFAGPGAGKSTMAAHVFAELKWRGVLAELVTEYAKDKVWDEHFQILENPYYVFGKQLQRQLRLRGKVDVIVTDSPLMICTAYNEHIEGFSDVVYLEFRKFTNINYFVRRQKKYVEIGRMQTEEEAIAKDEALERILGSYSQSFVPVMGQRHSVDEIVADVLCELAGTPDLEIIDPRLQKPMGLPKPTVAQRTLFKS